MTRQIPWLRVFVEGVVIIPPVEVEVRGLLTDHRVGAGDGLDGGAGPEQQGGKEPPRT